MTFSRAFAPATVANLGVGFDILGLAIHGIGDTIEATFTDTPGVVIRDITGDDGRLPRAAEKNTASVAAQTVLDMIQAQRGVALTIHKGLPLNSGLGSSASSAVAAAVAVNALFGEPLAKPDLLPACLEGEALVSGYHADNVGPCLLGGITLIGGITAAQIRNLPVPPSLWLALVTPAVDVPTAEARAVLPQSIGLKQMVSQTSSVAQLLDAIYRGDVAQMGRVMELDCVVEPARAYLMPKLKEARAAAKEVGAYGLVISGAGPTLCAICDSQTIAQAVADTLRQLYLDHKIGCLALTSQVNCAGAQLLPAQA